MVSLDDQTAGKRSKQGRWTEEEQQLFASAVQIYGKRWKKLEQVMGTRTSTQCRSHGQKYFLKLKKEQSKTIVSDSTKDENTESSEDLESPEITADLEENDLSLEEMDNNQLRSHLDRLVQVNLHLTKVIQRLRLVHCDHGGADMMSNSLEKKLGGVVSLPFPVKTTEVKVIFQAPESLS